MAKKSDFLMADGMTAEVEMQSGRKMSLRSTHSLPTAEAGRTIVMLGYSGDVIEDAVLVEPVIPYLSSPMSCRIQIPEGTFAVPYNTIVAWEYADKAARN